MFEVKMTTLFLSVGQDEANIALDRCDGMFKRLPEKLINASKYRKTTERIAIGDTASWIKSLTASNGRSSTAFRVGLDEAAFMTPKESHIELKDVLRNVTPTIDQTDGQLVIISTANGVGNEYQRIFMEAVRGNNNFCAVFISCWDDPGFTQEKRDNLIKDFGEQSVNQEYPRTYTEAFLASGSPRFDMKSVARYIDIVIEPIMRGHLDRSGIEANDNGGFKVYRKRKKYGQYLVVADVGEGVGGDPSIAKVYDRMTQEQVAEWYGQLEPSKFGTILSILGTIYNNAIIVCEANNHGHSTLNTLVNQERYPDHLVFTHDNVMRERPDDDFNRGMVRYGWRTTNTTRPIIINNMATMLIDGEVMPMNLNDVNELQSFVIKNGKAQAESGCHDDACFVSGTKVLTSKGNIAIEKLCVGDLVMTRNGLRRIIAKHIDKREVISRLNLIGTKDHPVFVGDEIRHLSKVTSSDTLYIWIPSKNVVEKLSYTEGKSIIDTRTQKDGNSGCIFGGMIKTIALLLRYIDKYGLIILEEYQNILLYTIKTAIRLITTLETSNVLKAATTHGFTQVRQKEKGNLKKLGLVKQIELLKLLENGKKIIRKILSEFVLKTGKKEQENRSISGEKKIKTNIPRCVARTAKTILKRLYVVVIYGGNQTQTQKELSERMRRSLGKTYKKKKSYVLFVVLLLWPSKIALNIVAISATTLFGIVSTLRKRKVYNIQVLGTPEYIANGILVHNCMVMCIAQYLMNNDTFNTFYRMRERKDWENCSICTNCHREDDEPISCGLTDRCISNDDWCSSFEMVTYDHQEFLAELGMADESHYIPMGRLDNDE
jgi:hypothetical protein